MSGAVACFSQLFSWILSFTQIRRFIMGLLSEQTTSRKQVVGRFAPSPTGRMHAGNIYAALMAWLVAKSQGGRIVLRIEDLDQQRSRPEYASAVQRDFEMLGLTWDEGPYFQHDREEAYLEALDQLVAKGLVYPCFCTRTELHASSAPHKGERFIYAGTCRGLTDQQIAQKKLVRDPALRVLVPADEITVVDGIQGFYSQRLDRDCGDFLIRRWDGAFAYQLAVVVDDAAQGISSVVRGVDLLSSTPQQVYLQQQLGLPHPEYAHIPLLVSEAGRRLSKRDHDAALEALLERFKTPEGIIGHIAWLVGLLPEDCPVNPEQLLREFSLSRLVEGFSNLQEIPWR